MSEEQCAICGAYLKQCDGTLPACFDCDNFSSSKYLDNLLDALENGTIDIDSDVVKEFQKRCPGGNCGKRAKEHLSVSDKIALFMVEKVGTMYFFWFCVALATIPLLFPSTMTLLQYISSGYLQLILLPLIMVGQELQSRAGEARAKIDFRSQLKSEIEILQLSHKITKIQKFLDNM